jgi:hypothetical protein
LLRFARNDDLFHPDIRRLHHLAPFPPVPNAPAVFDAITGRAQKAIKTALSISEDGLI